MKVQCCILYVWLSTAAELSRLLLRMCNLYGKLSSLEYYWRWRHIKTGQWGYQQKVDHFLDAPESLLHKGNQF